MIEIFKDIAPICQYDTRQSAYNANIVICDVIHFDVAQNAQIDL